MPITINPAFATELTNPTKRPVHTIALSFTNDNTDIVYLTDSDEAGFPTDAPVIRNVIRNISGTSQRINPAKSTSTIGSISFQAVDVGGQVSAMLASKRSSGNGVRHKRVVVYSGFAGMAWIDYEQNPAFYIDGDLSTKDAVISFNTFDAQAQTKKTILEPHQGNLSASVTADQTHIPALTTDGFDTFQRDSSYKDRPGQVCSYIKIGTSKRYEIVCHSGLFNHPSDGLSFQVLDRGSLGTIPLAHSIDAAKPADRQPKITEHTLIEGAAPKLAYALLTGDLYGQSGGQLPPHWHLGLPPSLVDVDSFIGAGSSFWNLSDDTGKHLRFENIGGQQGKEFIQREILRWLVAVFAINQNGSLSLKILQPPTPTAAYSAVLDTTNIITAGSLVQKNGDVVNIFAVKWNHIDSANDFTKTTVDIDGNSISVENLAKPLIYKFYGVTSGASTENDIYNTIDAWSAAHSTPPLDFTITAQMSAMAIQVGDNVMVDYPHVRDPITGSPIKRTMQVQQRKPDFKTGRVVFSLFAATSRGVARSRQATTSVLPAGFYAVGTDLSGLVVNGVLDGGTISGGITFNAGIHRHSGDLEIRNCVITGNVSLRVDGHLTFGAGLVDGKGRALSGSDGFGYSKSQGAITQNDNTNAYSIIDIIDKKGLSNVGRVDSIPFYPIVNSSSGVTGFPESLSGVGGFSGTDAVINMTDGSTTVGSGGQGGLGGAALMVTAKGISFLTGSKIDLSGTDGLSGSVASTSYTFGSTTYATNIVGGGGGGGDTGGLMMFVDGNHSPPFVGSHVNLIQGVCPNNDFGSWTNRYGSFFVGNPGGIDRGEAAYSIQYIPAVIDAVSDTTQAHKLSAPSSLVLAAGSTPPSPAAGGKTMGSILATWTPMSDPDCTGYEILARRSSDTDFIVVGSISSVGVGRAEFPAQQGVTYVVRIRSLSVVGAAGHSDYAEQSTLLITTGAALTGPQLTYSDGQTIENLKPAQSGSTVGADWGVDVSGIDTGAVSGGRFKSFDFPDSQSKSNWIASPGNSSGIGWVAAGQPFTGGGYIYCNAGTGWHTHGEFIPLTDNLIEIHFRLFIATAGLCYLGWEGYDESGGRVNINGADSHGTQYFHAANGVAGSGQVDFIGYSQGRGETVGTTAAGTLSSPGKFHPSVVKIRPVFVVNYPSAAGATSIDFIRIRTIQTASETPYSDGQTIDALQPAEVNAGDNQNVDWTAPALAAKEPAQAGADVTGTNVALGADTGSVGSTAKRIFVNPVSGEMEVWADAGAGVELVGSVGLSSSGVDFSIMSGGSTSVGADAWGGDFRSHGGLGVYGYSETFNGVSGASNGSGAGVAGASATGTGVRGTSNGTGFAFGGDFYGSLPGATGVRSKGPAGGAAFYAQQGAYLPFTGAHPTIIPGDLQPEVGDILCEKQIVATHGISDAIAISGFGRYQQNAIGIFVGSTPFSETPYSSDPALKSLTPNQQLTLTMDMERAVVNALGDGLVSVCDEAGEILAGDLICVAGHRGKGCRQLHDGDLDDVVRSYTVAIAREDAIFDDDGLAKVACFYKCG